MIDNKCKSCLFRQLCPSNSACDNYAPVGDEAEDTAIDTYIEEQRFEFRNEWYAYVPDEFE